MPGTNLMWAKKKKTPDLVGPFWCEGVVSSQGDCGIPGRGSRREKGENRLGLTHVHPLLQVFSQTR